MSLPTKWVEALFTKLTLAYGRDFLGRWEGIDVSDVKTDWGHELSGFERHPEAIAYALANLPIRPPTVLEFRALCRRAPVPDAPRLESPRANPERVKAELAKLAPMLRTTVEVDRKDWARSLLARDAVLAEMGITGETADGDIDATEAQWGEIHRRVDQRLKQKLPAAPVLSSYTAADIEAQPAAGAANAEQTQQSQPNGLPQGARLETADRGMVQGMVRYVDGAGQPLSDWTEDEADALAQAIQRGRGAPAEKLLRDHFVAAARADTAMQGNDAAQMLRMAEERDALVKQLVDAGYTQAEIGANSLGLPLEEFNRLVKEGIYSRERGAPDSLFPKRSTSRKAAASTGKKSKPNQPAASSQQAQAATESVASKPENQGDRI